MLCKTCGQLIVDRKPNSKFCTDKCRTLNRKEYAKTYKKEYNKTYKRKATTQRLLYMREYMKSDLVKNKKKEYERTEAGRASRKALKARRRARMRGASVATLTAVQWQEILQAFSNTCAYCPAPATSQDHVMPLSRGGEHTAENVVPACAACNLAKSAKTLEEWGRRSEFQKSAKRTRQSIQIITY